MATFQVIRFRSILSSCLFEKLLPFATKTYTLRGGQFFQNDKKGKSSPAANFSLLLPTENAIFYKIFKALTNE